jgi:hypothetical protein
MGTPVWRGALVKHWGNFTFTCIIAKRQKRILEETNFVGKKNALLNTEIVLKDK